MNSFKCVVIGAPVTGRTSLINTFMSGSFDAYKPNGVLTTYDVNFIYKSESLKKDLIDSGYDENLVDDDTNSNSYNFKIYDYEIDKPNFLQCLTDNELNKIDLVILCYQSFSKKSKEFLSNEALRFVNSHWPNTPRVLVSCFYDLVKNDNIFENDLKETLSAKKLIYCSSLENYNINKVFIDSFKLAIINRLANKGSENLRHIKNKFEEELSNDWVICQSKKRLQREIFGMNEPMDKVEVLFNQKLKSLNLWKSASRIFISLVAFGCVCMYFLVIEYCGKNRNHCDEIYELSKEAIDDSVSTLNESYTNLVQQLTGLKK
ncbi:unnamed protein product [Brachionus calyciflorus]|uniref:Uncharacterized protein n=1 Tax=Brachionus calyciflorus TaxID=104777 RepID=A0A814JEE9_9BILA|nr:unnamed protein product [Brachionus calyciflorus]